jgi:SAM-dependent methyltransferase
MSAHSAGQSGQEERKLAPPGSRVLEIGANPYFVTSALLHDLKLDIVCLGRPPLVWPGSPVPKRSTTRRRFLAVDASVYSFDEIVCNAEKDRLPLPNSSFDLVIATEILEHLIFSPTQFVFEIHRVPRPGGHLLLTAPNAVQLRYLTRWLGGRSVWDQYSGYGVYGRHQREYTASEVRELLASVGFCNVQTETYYAKRLRRRALENLKEVAYWCVPGRRPEMSFVATASGNPLVAYPDFLYRSLYAKPTTEAEMLALGAKDERAMEDENR